MFFLLTVLTESKNDKKDKINQTKKNEYKLTDKFIDDGDCLKDAKHRAQTVEKGFFVARGNIDVINPSPSSNTNNRKQKPYKSNKTQNNRKDKTKKLPDIPDQYKDKLQTIME